MLEPRVPLNNLFTFGQGQLQECLSQERKSKFPFLQNAKLKKTPLLHKLVSQQRQKLLVDSENNNKSNIPQKFTSHSRIMSQSSRKVKFSLDKQKNQSEQIINNSIQTRRKKKSSLPKVLKNVFPDLKPLLFSKRKITSAEPSVRYFIEQESSIQLVQPFNLIEGTKFQSCFQQTRPKSVMILSQDYEIAEQKIKTLQNHRSRLYSKAYRSKADTKLRGAAVNSKIIDNINQLKKIYC